LRLSEEEASLADISPDDCEERSIGPF
jgi:hypothetical protein